MIKYNNFEGFDFNLVEVVLNNSCPLDCSYCFMENKGGISFMSKETLTNIFLMCKYSMEINPRDFISVMFSLKEPLLSWNVIKNTIDNLDFDLDKYNIFCTINTNGVLLTDDILKYCQDHYIDIHISLDGPKDIHDKRRVYRGINNKNLSSHDKVMEIIKKYPNCPKLSYMTTINKEDLDRIEEIFNYMSSLPISCFVYALNKFDNWDTNSIASLEKGIKNFINKATPQQLARTRFCDTAASSPNLGVTNSIKILQDGSINLQPPILNDEAKYGEFISKVKMGNVNTEITVPIEYQNTTYENYEIIGNNCSSNCLLYDFCKKNQNDKKIYVNDFSCLRVQHFKRMAIYASGGSMTDQEYEKIIEKTSLFNAVINVTDNCNLRCPYCFTEHNTRVIDLGTMKSAIMFILREYDKKGHKSDRTPAFNFFGGEPMLHFNDIIKPTVLWTEESGLREKYKISFGMTTNGTLLTEENLKWLKIHNISILLSIDGDKPTQDSQRPTANGQSSFDLIYKNIPNILKYYPSVTFRSAVEPFNADKILDNYLFARNNNFMNYFITPNVSADWSLEEIHTAMEQLALIGQVFYQDITHGTIPLMWNELIVNMREHFYKDVNTDISFNHCGIGTNSIGIATNGDLFGCQEHNTYLERDIFYIGDIFTGIDKDKHKRLLSEFKKEKHPICIDDPDRCNHCSFYDFCAHHYCPSHNLTNGNGAIENKLITCVWKDFMSSLALVLLEQAKEEENLNFLNFLQMQMNKTNNKEFSIW